MGNTILLSVIIGLASSLIIFPFSISKEKKVHVGGLISTFVLTTLIVFGFYYLTSIDRNLSSTWPLFIIVSVIGAIFASGRERLIKGGLFIISLALGLYILTAPIFNADEKYEYAQMDEKTEIKAFDESKTPASVPPKFARNKMRKAFGQVPNTSYYDLGNLQIQKVKGEFVYIAPVEFSGFFKWFNGKVTPGYFIMSATNSSANPEFVKEEMTFTVSSYFNKNIKRHIRMNYPNRIFIGNVQLEVNDEGKPFYIRTFGDFVSARNGVKVSGVVVVDPSTGEMNAYSLAESPSFIDGAVSPEAVSKKNSYYGNYIHGFWNSMFAKSDVKVPSDEGTEANVSPIFDENGDMYYFTDFTSPKEGVDSMLGYSLTNGRTGEATFYTGNQQKSYMDSQGALDIIEKKFIEKEWNGEMPVLYNFYGEASWLTPVMDSNGFLQNYFIVSAANPEISVYASTPNDALKRYKTALQRGGSSVDGSSNAEQRQVKGNVLRVYKEKADNFTIVSFLLDNKQSYIISSENDPMAIYLQEGDSVTVTYLNTGESFLPVKDIVIEGLE